MTYLSPSTWWAKVFRFIGKCQSADYKEQYKFHGVRFFDLKLSIAAKDEVIIKNGNIEYKGFEINKVLNFFNEMSDVMVRITLEVSFDERLKPNYEHIEKKFKETCKMVEAIYPDVKFIGGYRSYDKKVLYEFEYELEQGTPIIIDMCSRSWIDRTFPFLTKNKNKAALDFYKNSRGILLLNFVEEK